MLIRSNYLYLLVSKLKYKEIRIFSNFSTGDKELRLYLIGIKIFYIKKRKARK